MKWKEIMNSVWKRRAKADKDAYLKAHKRRKEYKSLCNRRKHWRNERQKAVRQLVEIDLEMDIWEQEQL